MAFNLTGAGSGEFHYLAEIFLSGTTLRYADEDLSLVVSGGATGYFYAGKLPAGGVLVRDLGTFLEAKEAITNLDLTVDNSDGAQSTIINTYVLANKEVRVFLGEGEYRSGYSEVYRGNIARPNGVRWDDDAATYTVIDKRIKDRRYLPLTTFSVTGAYPNVEARYKNTKVPIVFGNWSSAAGTSAELAKGLTVPAVMSSTLTRTFTVAAHGLKGIDRILKNSVVLNPGQWINKNLTAATFRITGVAYDATTDIMSVNCQGIATIGGSLIEKPGRVLRSLYTTFLGLTSGDLDLTAISDVDTASGNEVVRRFIDTEISSETLCAELLNESNTDLRFVRGKYSPKYRSMDLAAGTVQIYEDDLIARSEVPERAEFSVERDPDRFYANRIRSQWRYDPINGVYNVGAQGSTPAYMVNDIAKQSEHGSVVERLLDFDWYYDDTLTKARVQRELSIFTKETLNIRLGLTRRAMGINPADQVRLNYDVFSNRAVQIRRVENNFDDMTTRLSGFNLFMLGMGRWANDTDPSWSMASLDQRAAQGFWCDATGWASSAADPTSYLASRWY